MKYLAIIYGNAELWASFPAEDWPAHIAAQDAWNRKYIASGEVIGAYGTADESQAQTVQVRDGVTTVTDGPYLETKEFIGSFYILDVESYDRAVEITAEIPWASFRRVELWPLLHEAGIEG